MRTVFKLLTIIASLLTVSVFTIVSQNCLGASNGAGGSGNLSGLWGHVEVNSLSYNPDNQKTSSCHSLQIFNYTGDNISYNYEFQHVVQEILARDKNDEIANTRDVDRSTTHLTSTVSANPGYKTQSGSQGVSCAGQPKGEYIIKAYTAIRASRIGGKLNVQVDENSEFEIF